MQRFSRWTRLPMVGTLLVLLLTLSGTFLYATRHTPAAHADNSTITLTPGTTTTPLMNPGKGWVLYWGKGFGSTSALSSSDIPPYTSVVYDRLEWSTLEPTEGTYNWSLIDGEIQQASQFGLKYAFGVMNSDPADCGNQYVTPKWVFDDGAQSTYGPISDNTGCSSYNGYTPVWTDAIYLQKLNTFLGALAQRYNGNSNVAFIDDCSYGQYGEQSVAYLNGSTALTGAQDEQQMQTYLTLFPQTQIEVAMDWSGEIDWSVYDWAAQHGIGLRQEGIPVSDGTGVGRAQGHAPGVVEYYLSYAYLKAHNLWNTQTFSTDILTNAHASYTQYGFAGGDAVNLYNENQQWVTNLVNQLGYYFQLSSATIPSTLYTSGINEFSLSWTNGGTTYLYQPSATVAVALLDSNNNVVQQQVFAGSHPRAWIPGQITTETSSLSFSGVNPGTYHLAVGILRTGSDTNPTYLLGNTGQTNNKWYVIANSVTVSNGTGSGGISGANLVHNPSFETGDLTDWNVWVPNGQSPTNAFVEQGGRSGTYRLAEYNSSSFQVSVYQGLTNIPNGTYQLSGWIEGSGKSVMQIRDQPGGNVLSQVSIPSSYNNWIQISTTATISGGQADIEFATNGGASDFLRVDDISFSLPTTNLVQNPGFETGNLSGWSVWVPSGQSTNNAFVEQGGHSGTYRLAEWNASSAFQVAVYQQFANVSNGTYTASAWIESSGVSQLLVRNQAGGTVLAQMAIPSSYNSWQQISLTVNVTGGQAEIEFYTNGAANADFLRVDDVSFAHQ